MTTEIADFKPEEFVPISQGTVATNYMLPLRKDMKAVLTVPSDITPDEAKKIMKFIREFLL